MKKKEFLEQFEDIRVSLWNYSLFLTKNRQNAYDIMSDSIYNTLKNLKSINKKSALKSYLFTALRREFFKFNKRINSNQEITDDFLIDNFNLEVQFDIKVLFDMLSKISEDKAEAIVLLKIQGFSRKEIAELQCVSEETVKSRISRGMIELRELMGVENE
jgi:RNA polymerase sigma-70 factor (ECF subfamily)